MATKLDVWTPREWVHLLVLATDCASALYECKALASDVRAALLDEECRAEPISQEWDWR